MTKTMKIRKLAREVFGEHLQFIYQDRLKGYAKLKICLSRRFKQENRTHGEAVLIDRFHVAAAAIAGPGGSIWNGWRGSGSETEYHSFYIVVKLKP